jgi:hypothetical protein
MDHPWDCFRELLNGVYMDSDPRKGRRPPFDAVLMFRVLVLQHWFNPSGPAVKEALYDSTAMR